MERPRDTARNILAAVGFVFGAAVALSATAAADPPPPPPAPLPPRDAPPPPPDLGPPVPVLGQPLGPSRPWGTGADRRCDTVPGRAGRSATSPGWMRPRCWARTPFQRRPAPFPGAPPNLEHVQQCLWAATESGAIGARSGASSSMFLRARRTPTSAVGSGWAATSTCTAPGCSRAGCWGRRRRNNSVSRCPVPRLRPAPTFRRGWFSSCRSRRAGGPVRIPLSGVSAPNR